MTLFLILVGILIYHLLKDIKRLIRIMVVCFILIFVFIIAKMRDAYNGIVNEIKTEQVDTLKR